MDVLAFHESYNFLQRYQLRMLIEDMTTGSSPSVARPCTVSGLVDEYCIAKHQDWLRRLILPYWDCNAEAVYLSDIIHFRHLSRAEITEFFASQAEWLLAEQLLAPPAKTYIDIEEWSTFCERAKAARRKTGGRWGMPHANSSSPNSKVSQSDLATRLAHFGETPEFWKRILEVRIKVNDLIHFLFCSRA